ncbi:putative Low-density lipoprotein receptor-related protein 4 [Glarea lozoyensis 74030]|uniref:Putative Low-density lipoprotein receptor-related protein 4 n=1 Tax=Glarea lozoyensis (strain ATCC 74030 / MF5533) TaxID=1104152 RepID=H0EGP5_GLAL7|nr:putative Low-density lipoprotein receptor-related protein 4 [Glarea lozoyensis 74030]
MPQVPRSAENYIIPKATGGRPLAVAAEIRCFLIEGNDYLKPARLQKSEMATSLEAIKGRPVAVLGGGVLGRRIACTWAAGGWNVNIRDPSPEQRNASLHYIENNIASYASEIGTKPGNASAFESLEDAVKDAWTVIEAVPEKLSLKIDTFADLEKLAPKDASLAGPCTMMDAVGLDTVEFIEEHYIKERGLSGEKTTEFLKREYINQGKLGAKSGKGGLYPPGATTKAAGEDKSHHDDLHAPSLYMLDIGLNSLEDTIHSGRVVVGSSDGRELRTLVSGQTLPDGLDISLKTGRIDWTNMGVPTSNDGIVQSCKLDGSDVQTVIPAGAVHTPKQLIIDQENDKLYFCDREGLRVMRSNLDGSEHEILIKNGDWENEEDAANQLNWPVGISVNRKEGKFYWTQKGLSKGGKGRIFRANIETPQGEDPSNRSDIEVLFTGLPEPIDLEIDEDTQTLFWTDRGDPPMGNSLNCVQLDGLKGLNENEENPKYRILAKQLHEAIGVKLDRVNKHIYMTDLGGTVYRVGVDGKNKKKVYDEEFAFSGIGLTHV